jgi:hypothetical protein
MFWHYKFVFDKQIMVLANFDEKLTWLIFDIIAQFNFPLKNFFWNIYVYIITRSKRVMTHIKENKSETRKTTMWQHEFMIIKIEKNIRKKKHHNICMV